MKNNFKVKLLKFTNLVELPGSRTPEDFLSLLDIMEFGDTSELASDELEEMCLMSLQNLDIVKATELVIKFDLGSLLKEGQIKNIAVEMQDEKLWEEYADPALHESFFNIGSLLYKAFPKIFPFPDAVCVELEVLATNISSEKCLNEHLNETLIVRILADGMDEHSILKRLFEEQLIRGCFPEAENILWILKSEKIGGGPKKINVISSGYWLDPIKGVSEYESGAFYE